MDKPAYDKHPKVEIGTKWLDKIRAAGKREDDFLKQAARAESIYLNKQEDGAVLKYFNILHSNVETIVPAIYSATPKPDIRRRFNDSTSLTDVNNDPAAQQKLELDGIYRQAAMVLERAIIVQTDDGALDTEMEGVAASAFTAGRAILRLRLLEEAGPPVYPDEDEAEGEIDDDVASDALETAINESSESNTEIEQPDQEDALESQNSVQRIGFEAVSYRDYRQGPAKRWQDVPWIAFRHLIPDETVKEWSKDEGVKAQLRSLPPATSDGSEDTKGDTAVWEVWCKATKTVKFIRESDGVVYKIVKDPLGLTGFFPIPRPIQPIERVGDLTPVCPYSLYEKLADELDETTRRIQKIIKGIRVRGGVASGEMKAAVEDIAGLEDNEIVELRGVEALAQQGGLDKAITWWPIEKSVQALQALAEHREQVKAAIYEVTGISDIVRGASKSDETARAQEIKSQWGSLRIQKMQRLMERCVREAFIMAAELIAERFTPQTLTAITGIEWNDGIAQVFANRVARVYRIDVETDSTIKSDMSKSKAEMAEFLNGTASFFQSMAPLAQAGMVEQSLMSEIYASFARTFRLGKQAEDALEQMAQKYKQAPPPLPPEVQQQMQQAQEQAAMMQEELQKLQQENQTIKADKSAEQARAQQEMAQKDELHKMTLVQKDQEHKFKMADMAAKSAFENQKVNQQMFLASQQGQADGAKRTEEGGQIGKALTELGKIVVEGNATILKAVTAPRKVSAIRGKDGKMEGAVSETVLN